MLSIIIPAYNEENRIIPTLQEYLAFFDENTEIIVVNDGSKDSTKDIVEQFMKKYNKMTKNCIFSTFLKITKLVKFWICGI